MKEFKGKHLIIYMITIWVDYYNLYDYNNIISINCYKNYNTSNYFNNNNNFNIVDK
jgi:hypothetical protein